MGTLDINNGGPASMSLENGEEAISDPTKKGIIVLRKAVASMEGCNVYDLLPIIHDYVEEAPSSVDKGKLKTDLTNASIEVIRGTTDEEIMKSLNEGPKVPVYKGLPTSEIEKLAILGACGPQAFERTSKS